MRFCSERVRVECKQREDRLQMDYERIEKPLVAGGGFSPGKLRSMLLGMDKKRKEDELESTCCVRSDLTQIDGAVASSSDDCKDVDVVREVADCSGPTSVDSFTSQMTGDQRLKDQSLVNSKFRIQEHLSLDNDSGHDNVSVSSSIFEFQKAERAPQRIPVGPFSKPTPSKWDDAQKWIASPTPNRPKMGQVQVPGSQGVGSKKGASFGYGSRQSFLKIVEVPDQKAVAYDEPDTKRIDVNQAKKETGLQKCVSWEIDQFKTADSYIKPVLMIESFVAESATNLSQHDPSASMRSTTAFIQPPSTARSVSMRDMGTEMTPIASQEPSRNGTPVGATTPMRSPISSRPSSPGRHAAASSQAGTQFDTNKELTEKELQMKTRREIMVLGTRLGKMNIAAWASKEEEDKDASTSLKRVGSGQPGRSVSETRAAAWEEAEKAKYMARFKREEMKIQAWENHQKAKTEAEMRKIEVEVERIRGQAQDRLMNKLAAVRHKAEEKRAAAEAKRNRQAAKTEKQAESIRRSGKMPSALTCWGWCS